MLATILFRVLCLPVFKIYNTIILLVRLCGCDTWSLTLRKEHRLRVIRNRVLRRVFRTKWEEVVLGWRRLHNEELHNMYASPCIMKVMKSRGM